MCDLYTTTFTIHRITIFGIRGTFTGWVDSSSPRYSGFKWVSRDHNSDGWTHDYRCDTNVSLNGWKYITINVGTQGYYCLVGIWSTEGTELPYFRTSLGPNADIWNDKIYISSLYREYTIDYVKCKWYSASGNHGDSDPDAWYQLSLN